MLSLGAAAVNIKGNTIHSAMHYNRMTGKKNGENTISDGKRVSLHKELGDSAKVFIIDKVSMFGGCDIVKLNIHIQAAFPRPNSCKPFSGAHIFFLVISTNLDQ